MKRLILLFLVSFFSAVVFSQNMFIQNKKFLTEQPNYSKDSSANFSIYGYGNLIFKGWIGDYAHLNSSIISLHRYPYVENNLPKTLNYYLTFPVDYFQRYDNNILKNRYYESALKTWDRYVIKYRMKNYNILKSFMDDLKPNLIKTVSNQGPIHDIYDELQPSKSNIYLEFEDDCIHYFGFRKKSDNLPSVYGCRLAVYDYKFETLRIYQQAFFLDSKKDITKHEGKLRDSLLVSLLGQFSQDFDLIKKLSEKDLGPITDTDIKLIEFKKNNACMQNLLSGLKYDFDMKENAKQLEESNRKQQISNSISSSVNQIKYSMADASTLQVASYANALGAILNQIAADKAKKRLEEDQKTAERMIENYLQLNDRQLELIAYFTENNIIDLSKFKEKLKEDFSTLDAFNIAMKEGIERVGFQIDSRKTIAKDVIETNQKIINESINNLYNGINSSLNKDKIEPISGTNSESVAMTNGGTKAKNMDVCQQKATSQWYKSTEYTTYMRTKLNADASDCKAKFIELTIQYCGDKLSSAELETMKKAAADERRVALNLRR